MKFSIEKLVQGSCRLGVMREVGKQKNLTVETPFCLLYTRAGEAIAVIALDIKKKQKKKQKRCDIYKVSKLFHRNRSDNDYNLSDTWLSTTALLVLQY